MADRQENWTDLCGQQKYWPYKFTERELPIGNIFHTVISVSQELRDLVKHDFKTEEEIRFRKQRRLTWFSIVAAILIGLLGIML